MPPEDLLCPVLHLMFRDPVVNVVGNTYDRCAVENMSKRSGGWVDPLTNEVYEDSLLIPNWDMRRRVQAFLDAHPAYVPDGWPDRSMPAAQPARRIAQGAEKGNEGVAVVQDTHLHLASLACEALRSLRTLRCSDPWSAAFTRSLARCTGLAVLQLGTVAFLLPSLDINVLLLRGVAVMIMPAAAERASEVSGVPMRCEVRRFLMVFAGSTGGHMVLLGMAAWAFPGFAYCPAALSSAIILGAARGLLELGWQSQGLAERVSLTLVGCSGIFLAAAACLMQARPSFARNPLFISAGTMLVSGSAVSEISPRCAQWSIVCGLFLLSAALLLDVMA